MSIHEFITFAKRWLPIALAVAVAAGAGSYAVTKYVIKPEYTAKAVMEVQLGLSSQSTTPDPTYNTTFAQTEADVASQPPNVFEALNAAQAAAKIRPTQAELVTVRKSVACQASPLTALFSCSATSHDSAFAAAVANSLATVFIKNEKNWEQSRYQAVLARIASQEQEALRANDRSRYDRLVQDETNVRLSAAQGGTIMRVVAPALPPNGPSSPHPLLNTALAFTLMLVLVLGAGLLHDRLDDSVRNEDDLKTVTDLPLLGAVPSLRALRRGPPTPNSLVLLNEPRSAASEAFRLTRTGIAFSRVDNPPRVLLVTSTFEGEGKSTVAANLAAAFAEEGKSVVLVDLDLRRPCLSKLFDVPTTGLTNLLLDHNADPEAFLIPTSVANLRVLPSGPIPPNPAPLVSSLRMRHLVDRLRSSADLVILDSPPLLAVTDPVIAGALADGAVVVVRLDRVHRRSLQRAVETLRSRGVDIVGLVVNSLARGHTSAYYAYGYAGYGEREQKRKKVAVAAVAGSNGSEPQA